MHANLKRQGDSDRNSAEGAWLIRQARLKQASKVAASASDVRESLSSAMHTLGADRPKPIASDPTWWSDD
jgi:hypothetical protein